MDETQKIRKKFKSLVNHLDERARRIWAATEAQSIGYGGISLVFKATGISRPCIHRGLSELKSSENNYLDRIRKVGGGRKVFSHHNPELQKQLERLIEPVTRGDPESPLRWTCKSIRTLANELSRTGIRISRQTVANQLHELGYSLQANQKTIEGNQHPDRNEQFEFINSQVKRAIKSGNPVVSVDTKKKELVGNYKNSGRKWHRKGEATKVNGHDFPNPDVPRAHPYGVYDIAQDSGFVNVGTTHDTATFAVASIQKWWLKEGCQIYPKSKRLLITADSGGSNGYRLRLWKWELQRLSDKTGLTIVVSHFPPGTSKWNKIEHRLFSFISQNWRGEPLSDYKTVVNLISNTKTSTGLNVSCQLDKNKYPLGRKISKEQWEEIKLHKNKFHGEWNYEIKPTKKQL